MKTIIVSVFLIAGSFFIAGCNTVHGIGKDIERGGEAIQRSVR